MDLLKLLAGLTWIFILLVGVALAECPGMTSLKQISGNVTTRGIFRKDDICTWNFVRRFATQLIKVDVTYFMVEKDGQCGMNQKRYLLLPGANRFCKPVNGSSTKCFYIYKDRNLCAAQMTANEECEERQITSIEFSMKYHNNGDKYPGSGIDFNYQMINCDAKVNSQCFGQPITNGSGVIESPNNGEEYGKPANCSWNFNPPSDGRRYMLTLKVTKLRNFFSHNNKKFCLGSYNLAINGKQMDCKRYVPKTNTTQSFCHQYYSPTCRNTPISNCEVSEAASFPINVTYFSDGRLDSRLSQTLRNYMGFNIEYNYTQCPDLLQKKYCGGSGHIQSFNYGNEYGKKSNILWKFYLPSTRREYMLILNITNMKNHFTISNGAAMCSGSYNLTINGMPTTCNEYVNAANNLNWKRRNCYQFYSSSTCPTKSTAECENSYQISFPVNVTYISDGRKHGGLDISRESAVPAGFKIQYSYTSCPPETTTPGGPSQNKEGRSSTDAGPQNQSSTALIAGVIGGGVFLLLLAIAVIIWVKRNKKGGKANNVEDEVELTQQKQQQQDTSMALSPAETYDVLQRGATTTNNTTYSTVGGATSINDTGTAMYATIGENGPNTSNANYETVGAAAAGVDMPITKGVATSMISSKTVYSAVQKDGGDKETVHYSKTMVDNVLYGSTT